MKIDLNNQLWRVLALALSTIALERRLVISSFVLAVITGLGGLLYMIVM